MGLQAKCSTDAEANRTAPGQCMCDPLTENAMTRCVSLPVKARPLMAAMLLAVATTAASPAAYADASMDNWWVYVHNDKASDLKALLAKGADPNVRYQNGQPALMRAVVDGAWGVFDALAADPRTDVNATNPANETALMYLAVAGDTDRARKLIARGAQVNRLGWTPLHYAASKGHIETARLLLSHKAMVNAPSPEGTTPIMMAAFSGDKAMVQLLLTAGADVTTRNLKGQNASDWAYTAKRNTLGDELATLIARAEQRRGGQGRVTPPAVAHPKPALTAPRDVSPSTSSETTMTGASQPSDSDQDGSTLGGVSGVRLNSYDD